MSHHKPDNALQDCNPAIGGIVSLIQPRIADLGGFSVRRLLPVKQRKTIGPWIFFDEMGPAEFAPGSGIAVRPHPHIGLATVTYLFQGEILHRDSLGSLQLIQPGDINLMVAGKGIVHSERERPEVTARSHMLHGLQLWLALPLAAEDTDPAFYHVPSASIPALQVQGVQVRVLMGAAYGVSSPVPIFSNTLYLEALLKPGQQLLLPQVAELGLYLLSGDLLLEGLPIARQVLTVLAAGQQLTATARTEARIVLIGGETVGPRFVNWNFVSSRKERIEQAKQDWLQDRFGKVPGDEAEFIPYPGE